MPPKKGPTSTVGQCTDEGDAAVMNARRKFNRNAITHARTDLLRLLFRLFIVFREEAFRCCAGQQDGKECSEGRKGKGRQESSRQREGQQTQHRETDTTSGDGCSHCAPEYSPLISLRCSCLVLRPLRRLLQNSAAVLAQATQRTRRLALDLCEGREQRSGQEDYRNSRDEARAGFDCPRSVGLLNTAAFSFSIQLRRFFSPQQPKASTRRSVAHPVGGEARCWKSRKKRGRARSGEGDEEAHRQGMVMPK